MYLSWYNYANDSIFYVNGIDDIEKLIAQSRKYDYIILDCTKCDDYTMMNIQTIKSIKKYLSTSSRLIVIVENKLGVRNLSKGKFVGITKKQCMDVIMGASFDNFKIFYPFPNLLQPQFIYTDERLLSSNDLERLEYYYPDYKDCFFDESMLYMDIIDSGMMTELNSAYIIECSNDGNVSEEIFIMQTVNRKKRYVFAIKIFTDKVIKKPLYDEGVKHIYQLQQNSNNLRNRGLSVLDFEIENKAIHMPYVDKPKVSDYLSTISDKDKIYHIFDQLWEDILNSSEHTDELSPKLRQDRRKLYGTILKNVYPDMIYINIFYDEGRFIYFDQEFIAHNLPAKFVMFRAVSMAILWIKDYDLIADALKERFGLVEIWDEMHAIEYSMWNTWFSFEEIGVNYHKKEYRKYLKYQKYFVELFYNGNSDYAYIDYFKEQQKICVELLRVFSQFADDHSLKYYPMFGTLLGAVRDGSIISWDTDIDLIMPRKDFDRLKALIENIEKPNNLYVKNLQSLLDEGYEFIIPSHRENSFNGGYMRFVNSNTTAIYPQNLYKKSRDGVHIDIIPIDTAYSSDNKNYQKMIQVIDIQLSIYAKLYCDIDDVLDEKYGFKGIYSKYASSLRKLNSNVDIKKGSSLYHLKNYDEYLSDDRNLKQLYDMLDSELKKGDETDNKVGIFTGCYQNMRVFDKEDFRLYKYLDFENIKLPIPQGYHDILKIIYGKNYLSEVALSDRLSKQQCFFKPNVPYVKYHKRFDLDEILNHKIVVFGAGNSLCDFINDYHDINIEFVVDNDANKWGKCVRELDISVSNNNIISNFDEKAFYQNYGDINIYNPEMLLEIDIPIVITSMYFNDIEMQLRRMGKKDNYYIYIYSRSWLIQ